MYMYICIYLSVLVVIMSNPLYTVYIVPYSLSEIGSIYILLSTNSNRKGEKRVRRGREGGRKGGREGGRERGKERKQALDPQETLTYVYCILTFGKSW